MNTYRKQARLLALTALTSLLLVAGCAQENIKQEAVTRDTYTSVKPEIEVHDSVQLMFTQALTYLQQQEYPQGIALLETLIARENRLAAPYVNLGIAYSRTGKNKMAELNFNKALKLDVGHAVANNELGLLYRKTGRFRAAKTVYQNALIQHPDYLPVRKNLGILCELYLRDFACAMEQYQAYLQYAPEEETVARWAAELKQRTQ
ncbi:MAG: tetratricopeptide repeat protein [Thiotrichales bacterium]|nr:MAG: tetratricopeptide repeat protein [Thiotrichales bacterium]